MGGEAEAAAEALAEALIERQSQLAAAAREASRAAPEQRARELLGRIATDSRGMAPPGVAPEDHHELLATERAVRLLLGRARAGSRRAATGHGDGDGDGDGDADGDRTESLRNRHGQPLPSPRRPDESPT